VAKRKLKGYVKPTLFMVSITVIAISMMVISKDLETSNELGASHVMNAIIDNVTSVVSTTENAISLPYSSDNVTISTNFYERDATEEEQQNSLIYYENTYLQNSGIVYSGKEEFDAIAVLDGTIIDIKEDEILNTIVYVAHENNITTIYYGLKDVSLKVNDNVTKGQVIGKSNSNKFCSEEYSILFEVNNDGQVINPEELYNMYTTD
jgi:stage II sporulation protein Q